MTCSPTGEEGFLGELRLTTSGNFGYFFENTERFYAGSNGVARINGNEVAASGSNANGSFVRLYNGVQICWAYQSGSGVRTWTFPAAFRAGGNPNSDITITGSGFITVAENNGRILITNTITRSDVEFGFVSQTGVLAGTGARLQAVGWWY